MKIMKKSLSVLLSILMAFSVFGGLSITASAVEDPTLTIPDDLSATYGDTLADVTIPTAEGDTPGIWSWDDPTSFVGDYGVNSFAATFTPDDIEAYNCFYTTLDVNVSRADSSAPIVEANEWTYDMTSHPLVTVTGEAVGGEMQYKLDDGEYGTEIPEATNAGAYTVYYKLVGDGNHNGVDEQSVTVTVSRADATAPTVEANEWTYDTSSHPLITVTGEAAGGEMQYKVNDGEYGTEIPEATNAGAYTVYYKLVGDANHNGVDEQSVTVNVAKATPDYTVPTGLEALCGMTLADVDLPDGWDWDDDSTPVVVVGDDHENATKDSPYPATFTPDDTDNYNTVTIEDVTVTVAHDYVNHEYQDSTCIYVGWEEYQTCAGCDYTTYVEIPKKTEHTPGMPLVTTTFAPTCTQKGYTLYACACGWTEEGDFLDPLTHTYDDGVYQAPTCTTPGGMLYTCTRTGCTDAEAGHTKFEEYEDEPALGHDMGAFHISAHPTIPGVFCMKSDCTREDCHYFEYELDENDNVNVYYKVNFYTNYALPEGAYYTAGDGAQLADTSAYYTKKIGETYVLSGESIAFEDTPIAEAYRAPTAECGWYKVSGWSVSLDNVASNLNVYAEYEAKDKYYEVKFVTPDDPLMPFFTTGPSVLHGHAATGPSLEPTKASDKTYNYNFIGWDKDFSKVYSNMVVTAQFEAVKRVYKLVYHDKDGSVIGSELFNNGDPALTYPTNLDAYADDYYSYAFTGKWHYENGAAVNLSDLTVPSWCVNEYDAGLEGDESVPNAMKGILDVYPTYEKTAITYPVTINVASVNGDVLNGAVVKVFNEGGIVAASKTISGTTSVSFSLMKGIYTVSVTYDNETLTDSFTTSTEGSTLNFNFEIKQYEEVETECGCLCHIPLIGRIYIMFHNIVYILTGKKTICCDDMFEGQYASKLKYTP